MKIERVNSEIKKELYSLIRDLKDERLAGSMISVMNVNTTKDLKYAEVYVSIMIGDKAVILEILNKSASFLKSELFKKMKVRDVPNLKFLCDNSAEYAEKIEKLLNEIKSEK